MFLSIPGRSGGGGGRRRPRNPCTMAGLVPFPGRATSQSAGRSPSANARSAQPSLASKPPSARGRPPGAPAGAGARPARAGRRLFLLCTTHPLRPVLPKCSGPRLRLFDHPPGACPPFWSRFALFAAHPQPAAQPPLPLGPIPATPPPRRCARPRQRPGLAAQAAAAPARSSRFCGGPRNPTACKTNPFAEGLNAKPTACACSVRCAGLITGVPVSNVVRHVSVCALGGGRLTPPQAGPPSA